MLVKELYELYREQVLTPASPLKRECEWWEEHTEAYCRGHTEALVTPEGLQAVANQEEAAIAQLRALHEHWYQEAPKVYWKGQRITGLWRKKFDENNPITDSTPFSAEVFDEEDNVLDRQTLTVYANWELEQC